MSKRAEKKTKKGWHGQAKVCPHKGKKITVEPLREIRKIRQIMRNLKNNDRNYALFVVGIHSGLRALDLLNLKWKDVLEPDGCVKKEIRITESKNKKLRHIPVGFQIDRALQNLADNQPEIDMDSYVFSSRKGKKNNKPLSVQRLHQLIKEWCHAAGAKGNFGTHTLRKSFAYHLLRQGNRIDLVMQILGHSSMAVTLRYAGITKDEINEAILKLRL